MRSDPLLRRTPLARSSKPMKRKADRKRSIATILGFLAPHKPKEPSVLRSEQHRRNVAALGCLITGRPAQACHVNFDKGMGLKVCDSLCFPLCPELHRIHDQGGIPRRERLRREWEYVDATRAELIARGQWSAEIEAYYQKAIAPLRCVVHGED